MVLKFSPCLLAYHTAKHFHDTFLTSLIHSSAVLASSNDTIYALSTAVGRAAIAAFRLSGPASDATLERLLTPPPSPTHPSPTKHPSLPLPRHATLATLYHPTTHQLLDTALCLRFPGPRSFTGEDVVELHVHGGRAVERAVSDALQAAGLRPAEPGEFTKRAFDAGRMDLTQVEGLADLLSAETNAQRLQALSAAGGMARQRYEAWRGILLRCLAHVEAVIDFGEEEDIAEDVAKGVVKQARELRKELERHLNSASDGELVRQGVKVVILGPPNAGKSSLLNVLAGRDVAIVSPMAGTTRDVLEVALDLGGYKVVVSDGAGIRPSHDPIEAEGVQRILNTARTADIIIHLQEPGEAHTALSIQGHHEAFTSSDSSAAPATTIRVLNKLDLLDTNITPASTRDVDDTSASSQSTAKEGEAGLRTTLGEQGQRSDSDGFDCVISCTTGDGIDTLMHLLCTTVADLINPPSNSNNNSNDAPQRGIIVAGSNASDAILRARHRQHVGDCIAALLRYEGAALTLDIAAEELRAAARALGRVTGAIDTEDVLDSLFSEFCIGK